MLYLVLAISYYLFNISFIHKVVGIGTFCLQPGTACPAHAGGFAINGTAYHTKTIRGCSTPYVRGCCYHPVNTLTTIPKLILSF